MTVMTVDVHVYSQYSVPRMMSLKYDQACCSESGVSVGISITSLKLENTSVENTPLNNKAVTPQSTIAEHHFP